MADVLEAMKEYHDALAAYQDALNNAVIEVAQAIGPATDAYINARALQSVGDERERLRVAGLQLDLAREEREQEIHDITVTTRQLEHDFWKARERGLVPAEVIGVALMKSLGVAVTVEEEQ